MGSPLIGSELDQQASNSLSIWRPGAEYNFGVMPVYSFIDRFGTEVLEELRMTTRKLESGVPFEEVYSGDLARINTELYYGLLTSDRPSDYERRFLNGGVGSRWNYCKFNVANFMVDWALETSKWPALGINSYHPFIYTFRTLEYTDYVNYDDVPKENRSIKEQELFTKAMQLRDLIPSFPNGVTRNIGYAKFAPVHYEFSDEVESLRFANNMQITLRYLQDLSTEGRKQSMGWQTASEPLMVHEARVIADQVNKMNSMPLSFRVVEAAHRSLIEQISPELRQFQNIIQNTPLNTNISEIPNTHYSADYMQSIGALVRAINLVPNNQLTTLGS